MSCAVWRTHAGNQAQGLVQLYKRMRELCKDQHASFPEITGICVLVKQIDIGYFLFALCFTTCI